MSHHDKLLEAFETYKAENEKFWVKASRLRPRALVKPYRKSQVHAKSAARKLVQRKNLVKVRVLACRKMPLVMRIFVNKAFEAKIEATCGWLFSWAFSVSQQILGLE